MKIVSSKIDYTLNSVFLGLYLILSFFVYYLPTESQRTLVQLPLVVICSVFCIKFFVQHSISLYKNILRISVIIFSITFLIAFHRNNFGAHLIYVLLAPLFAFSVYHSFFNVKILYLQYLLLAIYFLSQIPNGALERDMALLGASRNFVSSILLFNTTILTIITFRQRNVVLIFPTILTMIISINAMGRGGIIASIGLFSVILAWKFKNKYSYASKIIIPLGIITILITLSSILTSLESVEQFSRFSQRGIEDYTRQNLREQYLANIDLETLIWGYDYSQNYLFEAVGGNPHNAYIRLHYDMGIMAFAIIGLLISSAFRLLKKNIFQLGMLVVLLLRAWTDITCFNNFYDFIIWYFIFLAFDSDKKVSLSCQ